jgi:O-methyltransferase involved in polyketide biosynthesis
LVQPKNAALRGQTAHCHVERIALDLKDRNCRHAVFAEIGATAGDVLLISEGVLPYFSNEDAADLAADLRSVTVFRRWILDFDNAGVRPMPRRWARRLQSAPFLFQVPDWFRFFEQCGWTASSVITSAQESARLGRPYPFGFPLGLLMRLLPKDMSRRILEMSGAALLRVS